MELTIIVPAVPSLRAGPNGGHSASTMRRHRKALAREAHRPCQALRIAQEALFPIEGAVTLDVTVRWPKGRKTWDRDNLLSACKSMIDVLAIERLIVNDREVRIGSIEQERATSQEETVMVLRWEAP